MYKIRINHELYIYYRGKLIYKRWINLGYGKIFYSNYI